MVAVYKNQWKKPVRGANATYIIAIIKKEKKNIRSFEIHQEIIKSCGGVRNPSLWNCFLENQGFKHHLYIILGVGTGVTGQINRVK